MNFKKLLKDNKAVFGLNAVQLFFATMLGIALLAYVIVIIMGTLSGTTILNQLSGSVINETGAYANTTTYSVAQSTLEGFGNAILTNAYNRTSGLSVNLANFTLTSAGVLTNATLVTWNNLSISYTYSYNSIQQNGLNSVLGNTSSGITGFFGAINPVYAILAVLVIILVLTVLVRVVQKPQSSTEPQL